jgi:hypothetical protein
MAEAKYKSNRLYVTDLPHGIELTGPQAHGLVFLMWGVGSKPDKRVLTSLSKLRLIEGAGAVVPKLTPKGWDVTKDLKTLFLEEEQ